MGVHTLCTRRYSLTIPPTPHLLPLVQSSCLAFASASDAWKDPERREERERGSVAIRTYVRQVHQRHQHQLVHYGCKRFSLRVKKKFKYTRENEASEQNQALTLRSGLGTRVYMREPFVLQSCVFTSFFFHFVLIPLLPTGFLLPCNIKHGDAF